MFESLLEKVLNKFLGDFIEGFDASNLHVGIWSGEVTITNVSLKADIIKMLELPLGIKFSHIGKLRLNVPWKSLTSAPVEVFLSDVFIILTAQHPDEWVFQDYAGYKKKFELLEKYKEQIIQKISSKNKAKDDAEAGYVQKLTLKIIDNIQLQIQNIHIRFEDSIKNDFAWGISLASLEVFTTDANWKKKFFDRTKEENKAVPLQKLVTLKNIGAYWNQSEIHFYYKLSKEEIMEKMRSLIIQGDPKLHPSYSQYILLISAEAKLIQNTSGKFDKPEFDFQISLQNIDLALENLQLQQVIRMAEMFSLFQSRLQKKKKLTLGLSEQQILEQKQLFVTFYTKLQTTALSKEEQILFEQAIVNLDIDVLCEEAKHVIKLQQKEQALKQEQEKKKGWGGWFGKKDPLIGEEEQNKLYAFIDELAEGGEVVNVKRPGDYIWFALKFSLQRGTIHVIKQFESKREGVRLA